MDKKYIIYTDLDGTFLGEHNDDNPFQIPKENITVAKKLIEAGHKLIIATGRTIDLVKPIYDELGLDTPVITNNGSLVLYPNSGEVLSVEPIPEDIVHDILGHELIQSKLENYLIHTPKEFWTDKPKNLFGMNREFLMYRKINQHKLNTLIKKDIHSTLIKLTYDENSGQLVDEIIKLYGNKLNIISWHKHETVKEKGWYFIEITVKGVSKITGIESINNKYNYDHNLTVAFGDNVNDFEMIKGVKHGVVMSNAFEELKEHADALTEHPNYESGVGRYLEKFLNLK